MSIKQLYDLQCLEQEIAAGEQALAKNRAQIGESPALKQARANLVQANKDLGTIQAEQKTTEYAIADLSAKMTIASEALYSGRLNNPKELQNLQRELTLWQTQRDPLEERGLVLLEKAEQTEEVRRRRHEELVITEAEWQTEQTIVSNRIEIAEKALEALKSKYTGARLQIPTGDISLYDQLRKTRGWAIARLEQGACGHCHLGLSTAALQRARSGQIVNCQNCGRLLFYG